MTDSSDCGRERQRGADPAGRPNPPVAMSELIDQALSRRSFLNVTVTGVCAALLTGTGSAGASGTSGTRAGNLFSFRNVPSSQSDTVVVPDGYVAEVLYRWGDPVNGVAPVFRMDASNTAEEQALQAGMGHDGMEYFAIPGEDPNQRGLLCVNHEYTDQILLYSDGLEPMPPARMPAEKVRKSIAAHGISVVEIARDQQGHWSVVPSPRGRRITADTPMRMAGPAAEVLGESIRGTTTNCAAGRTPWGTYLTCEENFHSVFGTSDPAWTPSAQEKRYGLTASGYTYSIGGQKVGAYRWWEQEPRFDLARPDNDARRFGYVVEIDPFDPESVPVKRTALGRIKHENAELVVAPDGRIVVYMGDDEANEFVYKFVSRGRWNPELTREAAGRLLDDGTLYAGRFEADGTGRWLELAPGVNGIPRRTGPEDSEGFDAAGICIRTREAASLAGATPMDRPEWVASHPQTREVYVSLTNNRSRKEGDGGANPRAANLFGHILRWREDGDDPAAETFRWQVFVLAGNPGHKNSTMHGNVAGDPFGCPDGLKFDRTGILWIQTDMSSSVLGTEGYAELGNNMMLAADPATGEVRRFLTGPRGCEITGNTMTPDRRTMFINIQHPGEPADDVNDPLDPSKISNWPDQVPGGRPRAATIAIRRLDGGEIGT